MQKNPMQTSNTQSTEPKSARLRMREQRTAWRKSLPWLLIVLAVCVIGLGLVLVYMLTLSSTDHRLYEQYFGQLLWLNIAVATLLGLLIIWMGWRLYSRWRRKKFGSRLMAKLALVFFLVGFLPGVLLYTVSYQFVSRTINQWFDAEVDRALASGLDLGTATLDNASGELNASVRQATLDLTNVSTDTVGLERLRQRLGASDVVLWKESGEFVAAAGASRYTMVAFPLTSAQRQELKTVGVTTEVQGLDALMFQTEVGNAGAEPEKQPEAQVRALAYVQPSVVNLQTKGYVLNVVQQLPPDLVANALAVQSAYRQYKQRGLSLEGLRNMYLGTLSLTLFLAVFGAVLLAIVLGMQLANPLLMLAEGVRRVAAGDLAPLPKVAARDELSGLTESFSQMTQQLAQAQEQTQTTLRELDGALAYLQTVQNNLSSGLLILDEDGVLLSVNPGAERLLNVGLDAAVHTPLHSVVGAEQAGELIAQQFAKLVTDEDDETPAQQGERALWEQVLELPARTPDGSVVAQQDEVSGKMAGKMESAKRSLVAKGTYFWQTDGAGQPVRRQLVVLDDMTALVSAQRAQAWAEVARRLAHEIKNPLTPIRLSAERLEMKLEDKLDETDAKVLHKSVQTIVDQVDALKVLVNEFRDYARLPQAKLEPVDINALIVDVLQLYPRQFRQVGIACVLDPSNPIVQADAQQLRQILHNLVQNAQYAAENAHPLLPESSSSIKPLVTIKTALKSEQSASGQSEMKQRLRLTILDNGGGFPDAVLARAFEPYVTTKAKGTGLGLPMVKKIAEEHGASVSIQNVTVCAMESDASHPKYGRSVLCIAPEPTEMDANALEGDVALAQKQPDWCDVEATKTTETQSNQGQREQKNTPPCVKGAKVSLSFVI